MELMEEVKGEKGKTENGKVIRKLNSNTIPSNGRIFIILGSFSFIPCFSNFVIY